MYADWPGIYSYAQLNGLFANPGRNDHINDTPFSGGYLSPAYLEWQQQGLYMAQFLGSGPCQITMTLEATLLKFEERPAKEQQEVEEQKESRGQVKRWRTWHCVVQLKAATPACKAEPIEVDPNYGEVLRDEWLDEEDYFAGEGLFAEEGHMRVALRVCS